MRLSRELQLLLRREYDYVVVDAPRTLPVTDSTVVGADVDAMIVVVRSTETEEQAGQRAIAQLRSVHTRTAELVLNGHSKRHEQYYNYYLYGALGGLRRERSNGKRLRSRLKKLLYTTPLPSRPLRPNGTIHYTLIS